MGSVFLSSGFDTSILTDGSQQIFAANLGAVDLQPGFPVKVNSDQQLISENLEISDVNNLETRLDSIITNPLPATLSVQNLITAYDTTPVDLNVFIATTLSNLSDLNSDTQYITASLGQTAISSNLLTNDVNATKFASQDGSIFIDVATPGDISVNSTTFDFNGSPVVVSSSGSSTINNIATFSSTNGYEIKDSTVPISAITGGPFLPLAGGTMTGDINLNNHELKDVKGIRPHDTNIDFGNSTSLSLGGIGQIVLGDFTTSTANNAVCIGLQNVARGNSVAIGKETVAGTNSTVVGYRSSSQTNTDCVIVGHDNVASANNADMFGVNLSNTTNNSLLIGNTSYVNIRPASTTCDLGTVTRPFKDIYSNSSITGPTYTRTVDNIVSNSAGATGGYLAMFNDATGKVITNSNVTASSVTGGPFLPLSGVTGMLGNLMMNSNGMTGVSTITTSINGAIVGKDNNFPSTNNVIVGYSNGISSNTLNGPSTICGNNNGATGSTNGQSHIFGYNNTDNNAAGGAFIFGFNNTNGTGQRNILIGRNNTVPNGVNEAFVLGFGNTNSTANSLLTGGSSQVNIRSGSVVCDLGTTGNNFKDLYLSGQVKGSTNIGFTATDAVQTIASNKTAIAPSVGPPGFRSTWAAGTSVQSDVGACYMSNVDRWLIPSNGVGLAYSSDGGITWTTTTTLTSYGYAGFSPSLGIASVKSGSTTQVQTSADGISWTVQANSGAAMVGNMIWVSRLNLFIAGSTTVGQVIQTSPDGITWTLQTATRSPRTIIDTGSSIVAVGTSGTMTSPDGIVWTNRGAETVLWGAYSPLLNIIIAAPSSASQNMLKSTNDGVSFTTLTNVVPTSLQFRSGFWSAYHQTFFFAQTFSSSSTHFYAFDGTNIMTGGSITLQGATPGVNQIYSMGYTQSSDRFFFVCNNSAGCFYGSTNSNLAVSGTLYAPNLVTIEPYGAWYSTTTYNPSFTANVNRLIPPTVASSGSLSLFTHSLGVLTYTGTRTRIFRFDYIISYLAGPVTSNMTFFNSKNASTVLGTTQTRVVIQTTAFNTATVLSCCFSDIISLATNDTIQLAAQCANVTTATIAFQFVMCNVIGLSN